MARYRVTAKTDMLYEREFGAAFSEGEIHFP